MDDLHQHQLSSIHATLTDISVLVGRLDERLQSLDRALMHHTTNEHEEFKEALQIVSTIRDDLASLQKIVDQSKGAWWMLAKLAAVIVAIVTTGIAVWKILSGSAS